MRLLELNQTELWYVTRIGEIEAKDVDGNYTGELIIQYSDPKSINLHLYPASGKILEETFGLSSNLDFVTHSNVKLEKGTLLYKDFPTDTSKYDFTISEILSSLTTTHYGLKGVR